MNRIGKKFSATAYQEICQLQTSGGEYNQIEFENETKREVDPSELRNFRD